MQYIGEYNSNNQVISDGSLTNTFENLKDMMNKSEEGIESHNLPHELNTDSRKSYKQETPDFNTFVRLDDFGDLRIDDDGLHFD